jgi:hypothetical protein
MSSMFVGAVLGVESCMWCAMRLRECVYACVRVHAATRNS